MNEEKKIKYYHIRANVFWSVLVVIGILFVGSIFFTVNIMARNNEKNANEYVETIRMEYGHIDSKLGNIDECYLCGNASESLMGYYRKFDTVGIVGLNEWYVLDLRLKEYDSGKVTGAEISATQMKELADKFLAMPVEEIAKLPCMPKGRADVLAGGAVLFSVLMQELGFEKLIISDRDNLEGYAIKKGWMK